MKSIKYIVAAVLAAVCLQANAQSKVYQTREITPEALVKIYEALGVKAEGRVAVKISTGEANNPNHLQPNLIKDLVYKVNGTIVECNTAYGGARNTAKDHWKVVKDHGFDIFPVDIMDEYGEMQIPVQDRTHLNYDLVGDHLANYDFMVVLNHFKGHPMGGYGGALKNLSIGVASRNGKAYIHSSGLTKDPKELWQEKFIGNQDGFLESMAAAAQAVVNYFKSERGIIYISVMNNMTVDCDCVEHPAPVKLKDYGILASTDPVALDQACIDLVNQMKVEADSDPTDLLKRIDQQHGTHTIDHAEKIGLGSKKYKLISIDKK